MVRLEQQGRIKGAWAKTESNREAKFYTITKAGEKALSEETQRWRRMSSLVDKLLVGRCLIHAPILLRDWQTFSAAPPWSANSPARSPPILACCRRNTSAVDYPRTTPG